MQDKIYTFKDNFIDFLVIDEYYDCVTPLELAMHEEIPVYTGEALKDAMQKIFENLVRYTHIGNGGDEELMRSNVMLFDHIISGYTAHLLDYPFNLECE